MQYPSSVVHFTPHRAPSRRYAAIAFVGLLHVGIVYALLTGLMPTVVKLIPQHPIDTHVIFATVEKPVEAPKPVKPVLTKPQTHTAPRPKIVIATHSPPITVAPSKPQPVQDTVPVMLASTHTTPPYPPYSRRLGHEGVVQLRMTIAADGHVERAEITRTSGWPELDREAAAWVVAHWRYTPATRDGVPVASTALAAVRFNLETVR